MAAQRGLWLGVAVGPSDARLVLVDRGGNLADVRRLLDPPTADAVAAAAAVLVARAGDPVVGAAIAHADPQFAGTVSAAMTATLDVRVSSLGPGTALARTERRRGCLQGAGDALLLDIGAELALGVVIAGRPLHQDGRDPPIAHLSIDPTGPLCGCGNRGCLVTALGPQALHEIGRMAQLPLQPDGAGSTVFDLATRAHHDDPLARAVLAQAADAAVRALQQASVLFGVTCVALRWPGASPQSLVVDLVNARLQRWLPAAVPVRIARPDPNGVAYGAALWARQTTRTRATLRAPAPRPVAQP